MSFRTAYGNEWSENGWRMCNRDECDLVRIPELYLTDTAPLRKGPPHIILGAWLFWYDRHVEEIDSSVWGWSEVNAVPTSNHLAGCAVDINAPKYPWGARVMRPEIKAKVEEGLRLFEGMVFWGARWDRADEMHYQLSWGEGDSRNKAFADKLLSGHLGIYKAAPVPVPTGQDAVALAIINAARTRGYDRPETIACLATGLQESNLNPNAVDSTGHRGVYQQDGGYPDRGTLDGQVRGFLDRLDAKLRNPGASQDIWLNIFWLQQRPSEKSADAAYANGRKGYLTEIKSRLPAAIVLYDRLAGTPPPTGGDGFMAALNEDEQRELLDRTRQLWGALFNENPSTSRYGDSDVVWANHQYIRNIDGHLFDLIVEHNAALGQEWAINQIQKKATAGDVLAQAFLDRLTALAPEPAPAPEREAAPMRMPAPMAARMAAPDLVVPEYFAEPEPKPLELIAAPAADKPASFSAAVEQYGGSMQQASDDFQKNLEQLRSLLSRIIG